ncbi:MAG: TonB-dependent receptor [Bacteroidales bacterium]|nr:TonB-dependent receptor [Bacteroidales bacterium]
MEKKFFISVLLLLVSAGIPLQAQQSNSGIIEGRIFNKANNEPVPFANLIVYGTNIGSVSDLDGKFIFTGIQPGYLRLQASSVGFEMYVSEEFLVTNANKAFIEIPLNESTELIEEIIVKASPFRKDEESPVSLRRIGIEQIEKNPGGNRDISKVIQSFPGVASTPAYRNDVIVRGGGPSENRFYLDGVEIPNLNHFATQGASGGPVGIINVDFIREVNFYSGAFPANTSGALSSVLDMRQVDGNKEKLKFRGSLGASDLALTLDGPIGENTSFIASARRSYLQFLFSVLELPFLPTYTDFQFKSRTKIDDKNEITFIGLGAIDQFQLNLDANETPGQKYILSYLPVNEQWNYTVGAVYKHYRERGYDTWVLSRNMLNNVSYKHLDNDVTDIRTYDYSSQEIENKFRYEHNITTKNGYKINVGAGTEFAKYINDTYRQFYISGELNDLRYGTDINMFHYGAFAQVSKAYLSKRWILSLGLRADGSTYSESMQNPLDNLSPRFSSSFQLSEKWTWNFNTGIYHQRPAYTAMGYKDSEGVFVNQENGLKYMRSDHLVSGFEWRPDNSTQLTAEGFYKHYSDYPFSLTDSIPLASKGADFGIFGDEAVNSTSEGRAYGVEVLGRWQDLLGFNTVVSYTFVRSEFKDQRTGYEDQYIPTAWDNKHLLNITATRTFKGNWYVGFKWRFVGGAPYTPYDSELSSIKAAWDATGRAYPDYSMYNQERLKAFHQLDLRVDKQFYFKNWSLNFYVDIQNVYNFKSESAPVFVRESFINPEINDVYVDDYGVERYSLYELSGQGEGTVLPTVGIIVEF